MVVGDKYLLLERVGEGGMGVVYKAEQTILGKSVAVKILHPHLINDSNAVNRFRAEARAASRLNHPNSISVIDFGETEGGLFYLTTEFLRGRPLADIMDTTPEMEIRFVATVMGQVLGAIEEAHRLGIIHRDLKPDNIFVETLGESAMIAKVLDFGIAKRLDAKESGLTTPGMVCGTPDYMAPEQARGQQVDKRADIYALGVVMYEMLTGVNPYQRGSSAETMVAHVDYDPPPPSEKAPGREEPIPESLDAIVMWSLAKKLDERFETANQFLSALEDWYRVYHGDASDRTERAVSDEYDRIVMTPENALNLVGGPDHVDIQGSKKHADSTQGVFGEKIDNTMESLLQGSDNRIRLETSDTVAADVFLTEEGEFEKKETGRFAPRPGTISEGVSFLIGRETEIERAEKTLLSGRPLELVGEAGIGKTALMETLLKTLEEKGFRVFSESSPVNPGRLPPLAPIRDTVKSLLNIDHETTLSVDAFHSVLKASGIDESESLGMGELLGVTDPESEITDLDILRKEMSIAWFSLIKESLSSGPLFLAFDDIDLYDEPSVALLNHLAEMMIRGFLPGLALIMTRNPNRSMLSADTIDSIQLSGLTRDEAINLSTQWLAHFGVAMEAPASEELQVAGGNPFFVEQLTRAMIEGGIPSSISRRIDLLDWRFERLGGLHRQVLQLAAVWGGPFNVEDALESLMQVQDLGNTTSQLKAVYKHLSEQKDIVSESAAISSTVANVLHDLEVRGFVTYKNQRWHVAHGLIEQTVEAGTPAEVRHEYHDICLKRIERGHQYTTVWPHSAAVRIAEHADDAEKNAQAADALLIAGAAFFRAGDPKRAISYWHRAVDRMRRIWAAGGVGDFGITSDLVTALRMLAQAMQQTGESRAAAAVLREAMTLISERQPHLKSSILLDLGRMDLNSGRPDLALEELQKAYKELSTKGKHLWWIRAEIISDLGRILARRGDLERAVELLADGMAEIDSQKGTQNEHAWSLSLLLSEIYSGWSRFDQALDFIRNALMKAKEAGSISGECESWMAMARLMERKGSYQEALNHLHEAYNLSNDLGDRSLTGVLSLRLAKSYAKLNEQKSALRWFQKAEKLAREIGDFRLLSDAQKGVDRSR